MTMLHIKICVITRLVIKGFTVLNYEGTHVNFTRDPMLLFFDKH